MDELPGRELYRLSLYADLVPEAPGCGALRIYRTEFPQTNLESELIKIHRISLEIPSEFSIS